MPTMQGMTVGMAMGMAGERCVIHPLPGGDGAATIGEPGMTARALPARSPASPAGIDVAKRNSGVVPVVPSPYGDDEPMKRTTTSTTMGTA